jgi:predicted nucleic acid-binding Zn ribbon protein
MEECLYFTNRTIDSGRVIAWAYRKECPKCRKGLMRKPKKKDGKVDKNEEYYVCDSCGEQESSQDLENSLVLNIEYKCPHCGNEGETTTEYKRKSFMGVKAFVFNCQKCGEKIGVTQKMKEGKRKKSEAEEDTGNV